MSTDRPNPPAERSRRFEVRPPVGPRPHPEPSSEPDSAGDGPESSPAPIDAVTATPSIDEAPDDQAADDEAADDELSFDDGPLRIGVLGCSGSYAGPGNSCSGYLLAAGATRVWVDCGPGTLAALQEQVDVIAIDALVISHSHPDHWVELPVLRNALRYVLFHDGLDVYTTAEVQEFFRAVSSDPDDPTFSWHTISDGATFTVGDMSFSCSETDHPVETMAIRVEAGGRSIAYSADTGPQWSFKRFDQPIDLVVCEGTLLAHQEGLGVPHLSSREAGDRAAEVGADRMVVTHLLPGADIEAHRREAQEAFGRPVEVARPGRWYTA